jgi:hypothetical protein
MSKADKKRRGTTAGKQTRSGGGSPASSTPNEEAQGRDHDKTKTSSAANVPKLSKSDVGGKTGGQLH